MRNIKHNLNLEIKQSDIILHIAPERFVQVIENLIDNAVSFSPVDSTIIIKVMKKNSNCEINILDHGMGIENENIDKIFQRFFSYRPGNNNKNKHSGLGLSIVKSIVEAYNGTISVKNRKEGGAEFKIVLPMVK